jgi:hypothetical protein
MNGPILGLMMTVLVLAQETAAVGFDVRNCWDCEQLTLEGAASAMIVAAGIGCAVAVIRNIVGHRERYQYRGISLKLK